MTGNDIIDISEYKRLKEENATLKTMLRRYLIFGEYGKFNNLEADLSNQLRYAETVNSRIFDNMLTAAFAGEIIYDNAGKPSDFVITKANPAFIRFAKKRPQSIIGRKASQSGILSVASWLPLLAQAADSQNQSTDTVSDGENSYTVSAFATTKGSFIATFQNNNINVESENRIRQNLGLTQMMLDPRRYSAKIWKVVTYSATRVTPPTCSEFRPTLS